MRSLLVISKVGKVGKVDGLVVWALAWAGESGLVDG